MTQEYHKPFIVRFTRNEVAPKPNELVLSDKYQPDLMKSLVSALNAGDYDYVAVTFDQSLQNLKQCHMAMNLVNKAATERKMPVINRQNKKLFITNPKIFSKISKKFVADDDTVRQRFEAYTKDQWEARRHNVLGTMHQLHPLSNKTDDFSTNQFAKLTNPKRGLEAKDLREFFTYPAGKVIIPGIYNDDFVGMFGVNATTYDMKFFNGETPINEPVLSYKHKGYGGYVIPMKTQHNLFGRPQVGTDTNTFNTKLSVKHVSGYSLNKNEYQIKDDSSANGVRYTFKNTDGVDMNLRLIDVKDEVEAYFQDNTGKFVFPVGKDLTDVLKSRGYDIHPNIKSISLANSAKYSWIGAGDMCGSDKLAQQLHPADAGFVYARPPKEGHGSTVIVVEGALKGRIVGKYITTHDKNGKSIASEIVPEENGIIIAQVAGTNGKAAKSVRRIAETCKIDNVILAFDADGRTNRNVAIGINDAESLLNDLNCGTLAWNPDLKGMDDMLLAVHNGQATVEDCQLHVGKAAELFPVESALPPGSVDLDGNMSFDTWKDEYRADLKRTQDARAEVLKDTAPVDLNAGVDISKHVAETPVEVPITEQKQAEPEQTLLFDPTVLAAAAESKQSIEPVVPEPTHTSKIASAPEPPSGLQSVSEPSNEILVSKLNKLTPEQFQQVLLFVEELGSDHLEP